MNEVDARIFSILPILKKDGKYKLQRELYEALGTTTEHIYKIRNGRLHFHKDHIERLCRAYNVNANYIFGLEENLYRKK